METLLLVLSHKGRVPRCFPSISGFWGDKSIPQSLQPAGEWMASFAEEVQPRSQARWVWQKWTHPGQTRLLLWRVASTVVYLKAICKVYQLYVVLQLWQTVPGWTNVTFPWIESLRKTDEVRHICPLLDLLHILLHPSCSSLLTKYTSVLWKDLHLGLEPCT